jgi:hypothetical protein
LNVTDLNYRGSAVAVISLSKWLVQVGITPITAWRWRKRGWLKTVNIAGRQYLTQEAIDEFQGRAVAGEFAKEHKIPKMNGDRVKADFITARPAKGLEASVSEAPSTGNFPAVSPSTTGDQTN